MTLFYIFMFKIISYEPIEYFLVKLNIEKRVKKRYFNIKIV